MRLSWIYIASIAAHGTLAVGIAALRPGRTTENVSISIVERKKPEPPPPPPVVPPTVDAPKAKVKEPSTKTTSTPKTVEAINETPSAAGNAPDFGISLTGGSGAGGMALPSGSGGAKPVASTTTTRKVLAPVKAVEGGDCAEPIVKAKPINVPQPAKTAAAMEAGISGKVRVEITVDATGRVASVKVLDGLGYGLDEVAIETAKAATFEPAQLCGRPTKSTFVMGVRF